jgi:hypothetical protein
MKHSIVVALSVAIWFSGERGYSLTQPAAVDPPSDAAVIRLLPRKPARVDRDDIIIVKDSVTPRLWQCTVYYTESIRLPWGRFTLGKRVQTVFFRFPRLIAATDSPAGSQMVESCS